MAQQSATGASITAHEIAQQPAVWREVLRLVTGDPVLAEFLRPKLADASRRVVLTGAGTSSYVGECLLPALARSGLARFEAISTTDLVASPSTWLSSRAPLLLVSFARSGNSPESVAAVELAEQLAPGCAHLIVTCSRDGSLYRRAGSMRETHAVLLPEATNDQGFAMTSSFSAMLLAAGTALRVLPADGARTAHLAHLTAELLESRRPILERLVALNFHRVVYLGSNELKGLAREAALKMLELSDGQVVSIGDSPLGFRHGPKTILNGRTLVVMFLSNDVHARRYELDLLRELRREAVAGHVFALSNASDLPEDEETLVLAEVTPCADGRASLTDLELCFPYVVFAQSLAMLRSLSLGLWPDRPNAAGTVNRVVRGVTIYPYRGGR